MSEAVAWRELDAAADDLGLSLPATFGLQARAYLTELARWSEAGALTGYREPGARVRHLVTESLLFLRVIPEPSAPLVDIGSGAGVPGLVLALGRPDWAVTLIEAARRRANFLRHVVRTLGLARVEVVQARAEAPGGGGALEARFWTATMRAVPGGPAAYPLARPFLSPGGRLVIAMGPETAVPAGGRVEEVTVRAPGELPWRRRFLILRDTEIVADVPRGTRKGRHAQTRRRQPEGRRR